jgi:hypothetical protein
VVEPPSGDGPQHGQPPPSGQPPAYGQPQYGQPQYGQPQYGQPQYGQPQYGQPQYGQPQYGQPQYGQAQYGQPQYGHGYPPMHPMGPNPYYAQFAPKPGCVPLRPLGVGDILDGAFTVVRRNPRATLGLSAIVAVLQATVLAIGQLVAFNRIVTSIDNSNPDAPQVDWGSLVSGYLTVTVGAVLGALFVAVLTGMLSAVVTEDVLGNRLSIGQVWTRIRPKIVRLIGLSVVVGIVPAIGFLFCLVPGVWLWGIWAVAVPAMVVENGGVFGSLARSRALVRGTFWRIFGIRALGVMIVGFIGFLIGIPFLILGSALSGYSTFGSFGSPTHAAGVPVLYVLITAVGSMVSTTFTAPIRAGIDALLYVDLRMRKEGLDIVLQQTAAALQSGRHTG